MPALAISAAKSKDEDIAQADSAEPEHKIIDIMAALEVSLAAGKKAAAQAAVAEDKKPVKTRAAAKQRAAR